MSKKFSPCIWFNGNAAEAANMYCETLIDTKISSESPIVTEIDVSGQKVILLNGGPQYQPNSSISFFYICTSEAEIDKIWSSFSSGGKILMPLGKYEWSDKYGWLEDKYGVSWQLSLGKIEDVGQKLTPSLMFVGDQCGKAEEAINFYFSIFKNNHLDGILRYDSNQPTEKEGTVAHAQFSLEGNKFMAMDSAREHNFNFSEGVSITIYCENQDEIDYYWEQLTQGGEESMCGWLKDKYGVSWQVIPTVLGKLMSHPGKAQQTARAFMEMRKIEIEKLVEAQI